LRTWALSIAHGGESSSRLPRVCARLASRVRPPQLVLFRPFFSVLCSRVLLRSSQSVSSPVSSQSASVSRRRMVVLVFRGGFRRLAFVGLSVVSVHSGSSFGFMCVMRGFVFVFMRSFCGDSCGGWMGGWLRGRSARRSVAQCGRRSDLRLALDLSQQP